MSHAPKVWDEVVVQRLVNGEPVDFAYKTERSMAARILLQRNELKRREIVARTGLCMRTIERYVSKGWRG